MVLWGVLQLIIFLLLGMFLRETTNLPVSGSIIGLCLLTLYFHTRSKPLSNIVKNTSHILQSLLSLFLIPVGAGILFYFQLVQDQLLWIILLLIFNAIFTLLVCIYTYQYFSDAGDVE